MRIRPFHLVISLGLGLGLGWPAAGPALAQVNLNLDALNPPATGQTPPARRPAARPATHPAPAPRATRPRPATTAAKPATPAPATTPAPAPAPAPVPAVATPSAPSAPSSGGVAAGAVAAGAVAAGIGAAALVLPERAPEPPVLAAPSQAAAPQAAPPPARPATAADAGSSIARLADGLRVIFAAGKSDLTPDSAASLTAFAKSAPTGETISFNVQAYAAGPAEDPSAARRLSLARALAIRAALMADGIASTRIYVRAMGTPAGPDGDPVDRVDIAILGATARAQMGAPTTARP